MATTAKRGLEQQGAPDAKRQKALSKESLAAMAAIAATARLPSQVMKLAGALPVHNIVKTICFFMGMMLRLLGTHHPLTSNSIETHFVHMIPTL